MDTESVRVRMLGDFSIACGDQEISDSDNRSRKVWLLLAYMIYCRNRPISQEELIALLWEDEEGSSNPGNALKTMFHRVRSALDTLCEHAGHRMIVRREGNYAWNSELPLLLDTDEFESLCRAGSADQDPARRIDAQLRALALYRGDFLPKLSSEPWVVPVSAYFHNLYVQTARDAAAALTAAGRLSEAADVCRRAAAVEPYDEELCAHLMRSLLDLGEQKEAIAVYQQTSDLLFDNFGVMPSEELKSLYREAVRTVNEREVDLGIVRDQLREETESRGALYCDYDFFRVIYHAEARAVARSGDAVHIALITVGGEKAPLSKRSTDVCMENLKGIICSSLRKGDVASRCSVTQYIVMLPMANYENACRVCERIIKLFERQYPHSPAELHYSVQPLEPNP